MPGGPRSRGWEGRSAAGVGKWLSRSFRFLFFGASTECAIGQCRSFCQCSAPGDDSAPVGAPAPGGRSGRRALVDIAVLSPALLELQRLAAVRPRAPTDRPRAPGPQPRRRAPRVAGADNGFSGQACLGYLPRISARTCR